MITYRFTAILTKRPYERKLKGTVKALGNGIDALGVVRQIIEKKAEGLVNDATTIKITISPTRKKS